MKSSSFILLFSLSFNMICIPAMEDVEAQTGVAKKGYFSYWRHCKMDGKRAVGACLFMGALVSVSALFASIPNPEILPELVKILGSAYGITGLGAFIFYLCKLKAKKEQSSLVKII